MIAYQDFVPRPLQSSESSKGLFAALKPPEFETLDAALAAANDWIQRHSITPLNVETVVLPHVYITDAHQVDDTSEAVVPLHKIAFLQQFIRVWYETE